MGFLCGVLALFYPAAVYPPLEEPERVGVLLLCGSAGSVIAVRRILGEHKLYRCSRCALEQLATIAGLTILFCSLGLWLVSG